MNILNSLVPRFIITNLLCGLLIACQTTPPTQELTNDNYQMLCTPLILKKNQLLIVTLPSSAITGYKWKLEKNAVPLLQLQTNNTQKDETPENRLHQQETVWKFKATQIGRSTLSFIYQLDWDTHIADNQRVQCDIQVNAY